MNDAKSATDTPDVLSMVSVKATGSLLLPSLRSLDTAEGAVEIGGMWEIGDEEASCDEWEEEVNGDE